MAACDQPADELREIVVISTKPTSKEEWFKSLMDSKGGGKDGRNEALPRQPKIPRVPSILRNNKSNKDCFEPIAVSIGPYHRNKEDLKPMEEVKASMARQYSEDHETSTMEQLYLRVEKVATAARKCYAEDATEGMSDEDFSRMMFVDGCFFLQFISPRKAGNASNKSEDIQMRKHDEAFVNRDLFLLENQLPFMVLEALSGSSSDPFKKMMDFIHRLVKMKSKTEGVKVQSNAEGEPIIHLLQLLRKSLLNPEVLEGQQKGRGEGEGGGGGRVFLHTYRSANELKKAGIHFRSSRSNCFSDVRYRANLGWLGLRGELRLPQMIVDDSTKPVLLNLVAYEMCANGPEEAADVSSYICFLDTLIDSAEDVMELRSQGILLNRLGSHKEVAKLFNKIADNLVENPMVYAKVNQQIEEHYKNSFKIGVLMRLSTHFKAPWSRMSFVAALIALVLSFLQTFYAIKQSKD